MFTSMSATGCLSAATMRPRHSCKQRIAPTLSDHYRLRIAQKTIGDALLSAFHRVLETVPLQCGKLALTALLHAAARISSESRSH